MALGSKDILLILVLPFHEHEVFFHLFVPFSISFIKVLKFSLYISFSSLVKFTCKCFIGFDAIVNKIVFCLFLILLSGISLLVYRNTPEFCV